MALLGLSRRQAASDKVSAYWLGFILIQLVVLLITFEFMRKPWEGAEVELEKIL